jgi:hypothetical protein
MKTANRLASSLLITVLAVAACVAVPRGHAQAAGSVTAAEAGQPRSLLITIVAGEGALNDIRTRTAREPIVQVDDENHKPVAGALVLFSLDKTGSPFANFAGGPSLSVHTDAAGRAVAQGFQITPKKGSYKISVHASYGELIADAVINQANIEVLISGNGPPASVAVVSHKKVIWIVSGILAAGAVAGIVIATQQSSPTTISADGTGPVTAPAAVGGVRFSLRPSHR